MEFSIRYNYMKIAYECILQKPSTWIFSQIQYLTCKNALVCAENKSRKQEVVICITEEDHTSCLNFNTNNNVKISSLQISGVTFSYNKLAMLKIVLWSQAGRPTKCLVELNPFLVHSILQVCILARTGCLQNMRKWLSTVYDSVYNCLVQQLGFLSLQLELKNFW